MTDTTPILSFSHAELNWLWHALRNVQARSVGEVDARQGVLNIVDAAKQKELAIYVIAFSPVQLCVVHSACIEGRTRTGDEQLMQHRVKERIEEAMRG